MKNIWWAVLEALAVLPFETAFWRCFCAQDFSKECALGWHRQKKMMLISFFSQMTMLALFSISAGEDSGWQVYAQWAVFTPFLWMAALTDWKRKLISNKVVLAALAVRIVLLVAEIAYEPELILEQLISCFGGGAMVAVVMFLSYFVTRFCSGGTIGAGDIKLMIVMGMYLGSSNAISVLLVGMVLLAMFLIPQLILKKISRTQTMPLAPALWCGCFAYYTICLLGR